MLKYRHTNAEDLPQLDAWVKADPAHQHLTGSHFMLQPDEHGVQCIEVEDDKGTVFYLKFTNALIVETQFPPSLGMNLAEARQRVRISRALKEAFGYFGASSKQLGYHAMLFNSVSESLIAFFEKLGFKKLTDYFKVNL